MAANYPKLVENIVGKKKNCSLRAIPPFPTVFSKGLFTRGVKGVTVWEWVKKKALATILGKGGNTNNQHFLLFP